jgi:hypothetical protein
LTRIGVAFRCLRQLLNIWLLLVVDKVVWVRMPTTMPQVVVALVATGRL